MTSKVDVEITKLVREMSAPLIVHINNTERDARDKMAEVMMALSQLAAYLIMASARGNKTAEKEAIALFNQSIKHYMQHKPQRLDEILKGVI